MDVNIFGDKIVTTIRAYMDKRLEPIMTQLDGALARLDVALARMEKTPADWLQGSWLNGRSYARGEQVQMARSRWMSMVDNNTDQPGNSTKWREC